MQLLMGDRADQCLVQSSPPFYPQAGRTDALDQGGEAVVHAAQMQDARMREARLRVTRGHARLMDGAGVACNHAACGWL